MAFKIEFRLNLPVSAVLDGIRHRAAYWQESLVPPKLRAEGMLSVEARIRPPRFELFCLFSRRSGLNWATLRGTVTAEGDGRSRLVAHVGIPRTARYATMTFAAVGLWALIGGRPGGIPFLCVAGIRELSDVYHDRRITREDDAAGQHSAERLDLAVRQLEAQPDASQLSHDASL